MKTYKMSGIFDVERNPYNRWGTKSKVVNEKVTQATTLYSYVKIIDNEEVYYFVGFDLNGQVVLTKKLKNAKQIGKKKFKEIKKILRAKYNQVYRVHTTKKFFE